MTNTADRPLADTGTPRAPEPFGCLAGERLDGIDALVGRGAGAAQPFQDLGNRPNPRMPLLAEIAALLRAGHEGRDPDAH